MPIAIPIYTILLYSVIIEGNDVCGIMRTTRWDIIMFVIGAHFLRLIFSSSFPCDVRGSDGGGGGGDCGRGEGGRGPRWAGRYRILVVIIVILHIHGEDIYREGGTIRALGNNYSLAILCMCV